ncbi:MAG: hypothetical protein OSB43_18840 [Nocardioides sp.]|uniref:hypothetical protein n=1 Tax=Nocardioides sp. TaxID=35761 RepID=UPI002387C18A|nr:hypothetical protein [Nocardioides sp.]MDE0778341.1 hypothetical protein [Nocardioides sp.]
MRWRAAAATAIAGLALTLVASGCARENDLTTGSATVPTLDDPDDPDAPDAPASPSPTLRTIPALPVVSAPPSGEVTAFVQQSSLDVARGQLQVVVVNDTVRDLDPTSVRFRDPRLARPLIGGNLRVDPAQSQRGYPFPLPARPDCTRPREQTASFVVVEHQRGTARVAVDDETDAVGRFLATRCQELALAEAVTLSWEDRVPVDRRGAGAVGTLTLVVEPRRSTARAERHEVTIDGVNGSHLLGSADDPSGWTPAVTVASGDAVRRVGLPLKPTRCDDHAFMEGGNATAFRVRFTLDGEPGEVLLRMTPAGSSAAIGFAQTSCGLG